MINCIDKNIQEIIKIFQNLDKSKYKILEIVVSNTDLEKIGYKSWIDLAQLFYLKMLTPKTIDQNTILKFEPLDKNSSFHLKKDEEKERYGTKSKFFGIDKTNLASFIYYYQQALNFIDIKNKTKILDLGINKGDEFKIIKDLLEKDEFFKKEFVGIDHSNTAIEFAKKELPFKNIKFLCEDINKLDDLDLVKFDLIISIGTLQSTNINFKTTLAKLVQNYLNNNGAIILAFPNSRWIDGENIYGAVAPNYNFSEMSLVIKDIHYAKKYLQQKKFRVVITGKDYLFLTARKIGQNGK